MGSQTPPLVMYGRYASTASQSQTKMEENRHASSYMEICFQKQAKTADFGGTPAKDHTRRIRRFALQSAARNLLPREAVAKCNRAAFPREDGSWGVDILYTPAKMDAQLAGVQICKSVWHCPVCAAKISERRREDMAEGVEKWLAFTAGERRRLLLVTFTLRHHQEDDLSDVFAILKKARRLLVSGRWSKEFNAQYNIAGTVRALELTHGQNGWHPHLHVLMFCRQEIPILRFEAELKQRWMDCVSASGGSSTWLHGCDVRFSDTDISAYITKWGQEPKWTTAHEMTKAVTKTAHRAGRTPMQLLVDYLNGDERAGRLWLQYAVNLKGERQLVWSHGLRALLGLAEEKTDEEIAVEQSEIAIVLSSLTIGAWRAVLANDARGELLEVAATGDAGRVAEYLQKLGIGEVTMGGLSFRG
jgi:hypothetical protein